MGGGGGKGDILCVALEAIPSQQITAACVAIPELSSLSTNQRWPVFCSTPCKYAGFVQTNAPICHFCCSFSLLKSRRTAGRDNGSPGPADEVALDRKEAKQQLTSAAAFLISVAQRIRVPRCLCHDLCIYEMKAGLSLAFTHRQP